MGCFYFPGWYAADRWAPIEEYGGRTPLLGYYRDSLPEVQDWHIRQAVQHNISFWVFDWYYDQHTATVLPDNAALDTGFLNAKLCNKMDFALMWCNEEAEAPAYSEDGLLHMVHTMEERYFSRSNYLKTSNGRCILVISRPDRLITEFGIEGTRKVLAKMSSAVAKHGGLYYVAITDPGVKDLSELKHAGIDAATLYCYASQGLPPGANSGPFETILPVAEEMWKRGTESGILPMIPTVSPDWDSRAWYGDHGLWRSDPTPSKFEALCRAVKPYINPDLGLAMVGTWNEFGEGTYIEPTQERGWAHLDAMQRVFFPHAPPHRHESPTAVEREPLDYEDVPAHLEAQIAAEQGNLVINPGFEREWGWTYFDNRPIVFSNRVVHSGARSLVLAKENGGVKSQLLSPGVPWPGRWNNRIPLATGTRYRVSAWVYGKASLTCALFDKNGAWLQRYNPIASGGKSGEWTELSGTIGATDAEAASFDVEVVPLEPSIFVDDIAVKRQSN